MKEKYFRIALKEAEKGLGHTRPNPPVGAVIVRGEEILGKGYHKRAGKDHAEVAAIKDAKKRGNDLKGATIYVTLEPCSKPGRVGACTDAIIAAGLKEVIYAMPDPNPVNRDKAKKVLKKAGIECRRMKDSEDYLADMWARQLIAPFTKHVTTGLPFVTVKIAISLDGKICDDFGDAKWISSEESRKMTGGLRERVDAIMVGAETVRKDNPSLLSHGKKNDDLIRVIISKSGKLPKDAQVFTDGKNETLVFPDPVTALKELGKRGCLHVLCEGGLKLARSLAQAGLVDRWTQVTAPIVIGDKPINEATRFPGSDSFHTWGAQ